MSGKWKLTGWELPDGSVEDADAWGDISQKAWKGTDFVIRPVCEEFKGFVPGEKVKIEYPEFVGYSVSGLPSGWKWNSKTGVLTGTANKTFTLKFSKKKQETVKVVIEVGDKPIVSVSARPAEAVSVEGSGAYKMNAKAKLTAAVKSGYAFAGWYADGKIISPNASYSMTVPAKDVSVEARAIPLSEDFLEMVPDYGIVTQLELNEDMSGMSPVYVESGTPYTLSAKGLPSGISLVKDPSSYGSDAYAFKGKAKKKGVYWVTFSAKNNGGYKSSCVMCFLVGGAEETHKKQALVSENGDITNIAEDYWILSGQKMEDMTIFTETDASGANPKSVKITGLPSGVTYKYNRDEGVVVIYGTPQKAGKYKLTVTTTTVKGVKQSSTCNMLIQDSGSVYVQTALTHDSTGMGKVTGGGVKAYGAKVTLEAKTSNSKKYFFAGWYGDAEGMDPLYSCCDLDDEVAESDDWRDNPRSFNARSGIYSHYAKFVTKDEDHISFMDMPYAWYVNPSEDADPYVISGLASVTKPTITVKNLPSGIAYSKGKLYVKDASKLNPGTHNVSVTAKNLSKQTAKTTISVTIPNLTDAVERGLIDLDTSDEGYSYAAGEPMRAGLKTTFTLDSLGIEVKEGCKLSVSGLPAGWKYSDGVISGVAEKPGKFTVVFTVTYTTVDESTNKSKKLVSKASATFNLCGIPDWAVGTFTGGTLTSYDDYAGYYEPGTISATVDATGKISGYYSVDGDKTKFSGSGFTHSGAYQISATVKGKVDGKSKSFKFSIRPVLTVDGNGTNVVVGAASFSGNVSKDENIASEFMDQNLWTHPASGSMRLPSLESASSVECEPFDWGGDVSLSLGDGGKVRIAYSTNKGSSSGSAQISHLYFDENGVWNAFVPIYVAETKKARELAVVVLLKLHEEAGKIHAISVDNEYLFDGDLHYVGVPTSFGYTYDIVKHRPSAH
jgi:hypothetical protein